MMSHIEDFIRKNKDQFDDQEPKPSLWQSIEEKLFGSDVQKNSGLWRSLGFWRAAAAVLFLLSVGLFLTSLPKDDRKELSSLEKEFLEIESYYQGQLSEKVGLISNFQKGWSADDSSQDLLRLEAMYMVLKEEMKISPSQQVKDALVLNLIIRLDILNKKLEDVETIKEEKSI
jgi:hypothetical protein